jgi:Zn-dependent protease/CBS domain-containing protein
MIPGGIRIGSVRGIPIRTHFTVLVALPLIALGFARAFGVAADMAGVPPDAVHGSPLVWGLVVAVALFASVLVHELAHSLYALKTGGEVRGITLLIIGGVSQMVRPPSQPKHEAVMALVGPLVSLALGAVLSALATLIDASAFTLRFAFFYLGTLNLALGLFNLLPAFPMDGGRVLRAMLTPRMGTLRATQLASQVGKTFAIIFGLFGLASFNLFLMLIAFFVWLGADGEMRLVAETAALGRLKVRDVMNRNTVLVPPEMTVRQVAERMAEERRQAFVITPDGMPMGLVTLDAVRRIPLEQRESLRAQEIATLIPVVSPDDELGPVLRKMGDGEVAVMDDTGFIGTLSREDLATAIRFHELERPPLPPSWTQRPLGH